MNRSVVDNLGLFYEGFDVYGLEDSDFNERVNRFGYHSCYISNEKWKCVHLGVRDHDKGEYRKMKNKSMEKNAAIFMERAYHNYKDGLKEPLPPMREPL